MTDRAPKVLYEISEGEEYAAAERMAKAMRNALGDICEGRELSVASNALAIFLEHLCWAPEYGKMVGFGAAMVMDHREKKRVERP